MQFHRILVPSDLSDVTRPAIELAANLVGDQGEIILLHILRDTTPELASFAPTPVSYDKYMALAHTEEAKENLRRLRNLASLPVRPVRIELRWGPVVDSILQVAHELPADLIVLATHVPRGLSRLFGSVAEPVLHQASCPVLTLRMP